MKSRRKFLIYLFISILSLTGFILFINTFSPSDPIDIYISKIHPTIPFFFLLFLTISCWFAFILKSKRRGVFIGLFASIFLLLQYLNYNNIFYTAILVTILILIEILFWKKR